jgi:hypothetical protein
MVRQEMPGYSGQTARAFRDIFDKLINLFVSGVLYEKLLNAGF